MQNISAMLGKLQGQSASKILADHQATQDSSKLTGAKARREAKMLEKQKSKGGHKVVQSGGSYKS